MIKRNESRRLALAFLVSIVAIPGSALAADPTTLDMEFESFEERCDKDDSLGCGMLVTAAGFHPTRSKEIIAKALPLLKTKCERFRASPADAEFCVSYAYALIRSGRTQEANKLLQKTCNVDQSASACSDLAAAEYKQGHVKIAYELSLKACVWDETECSFQLIYTRSPHVKIVEKLTSQNCLTPKGGDSFPTNCNRLSLYKFHTGNKTGALEYFARDCKSGNEMACFYEVAYHLLDNRSPAAIAEATKPLKKYCDGENRSRWGKSPTVEAALERICTSLGNGGEIPKADYNLVIKPRMTELKNSFRLFSQ